MGFENQTRLIVHELNGTQLIILYKLRIIRFGSILRRFQRQMINELNNLKRTSEGEYLKSKIYRENVISKRKTIKKFF